jgi:hypothetical protein
VIFVWIVCSVRGNCLLKHVIEGNIEGRIEVTGRLGRRCKQLLDDLKETSGSWKLKEEALARTLWRIRLEKGYRPVVRQTTEWMNEWMNEWTNEWLNEWIRVLIFHNGIFNTILQRNSTWFVCLLSCKLELCTWGRCLKKCLYITYFSEHTFIIAIILSETLKRFPC